MPNDQRCAYGILRSFGKNVMFELRLVTKPPLAPRTGRRPFGGGFDKSAWKLKPLLVVGSICVACVKPGWLAVVRNEPSDE